MAGAAQEEEGRDDRGELTYVVEFVPVHLFGALGDGHAPKEHALLRDGRDGRVGKKVGGLGLALLGLGGRHRACVRGAG